jgi:hypothetical protein
VPGIRYADNDKNCVGPRTRYSAEDVGAEGDEVFAEVAVAVGDEALEVVANEADVEADVDGESAGVDVMDGIVNLRRNSNDSINRVLWRTQQTDPQGSQVVAGQQWIQLSQQ